MPSAICASIFFFILVRSCLSFLVVSLYGIWSVSHCFLVKGSLNNEVIIGGSVIRCLPFSEGVPTSGKPNGMEWCCQRKVASGTTVRFQYVFDLNVEGETYYITFRNKWIQTNKPYLDQPAAGCGKNLKCPLGTLLGTPACMKSPRKNIIWSGRNVCKKPYLLCSASGSNHKE